MEFYHISTEWLRLEGSSGIHLIWPPLHLEAFAHNQIQMGFFNTYKDGSTTSLGNQYQCSVTPTVKKGSLLFNRVPHDSVCNPLKSQSQMCLEKYLS